MYKFYDMIIVGDNMNHQIDVDKYIHLVPMVDRLEELEKEITQKKQEQAVIEQGLVSANSSKEQFLGELQTLSTLKSKLLGGKLRKSKVKDLEQRLSVIEKELVEKQDLEKELTNQITKMENELQNLQDKLNGFSYKGYEEVKDGLLVITDNPPKELDPLFNAKQEQKSKNSSPKDTMSEYAMVHSTGFFPKNRKILCNYDGNKIGKSIVKFRGVRKEVNALSHRHTTHFTLNNIVKSTGDGAGKWEQPEFIIVEPFNKHQEQFLSVVPSDSYTLGSVALDSPYYLVREDALDKIPIEERNNNNIIVYRGDAEVCLHRLLRMLGYPILETDPNFAGHADSKEGVLENVLSGRDLAVNFIQDNSFGGKEKRKFTLNDIQNILDIEQESLQQYSYRRVLRQDVAAKLSKELNMLESVINAIIGSGIRMDMDGNFYFDTDEKVYEVICDNSKLDLANLKKVCNAYKSIEKNSEENKDIDLIAIGKQKIGSVYQFRNMAMCQAFFGKINKLIDQFQPYLNQMDIYIYPHISANGFFIEVSSYLYTLDVMQIASPDDSLDVAYANTLNYLYNLNSTLENDTKNYSRGSMNIFYFLFVINIIVLGIIISFVFLTYKYKLL